MRRAFAFAAALLVGTALHAANELLVDRTTLQRNDLVTITVALEGTFAGADDVRVPLRNLQIVDDLGQSTMINVTNAGFLRRKVFRFLARPIAPGAALVGPLTVVSADGIRETLPPVSLQVLPDVTSASNDPRVLLRELLATNRDPFFVVAEIDKSEAFIGEQVVVTWWVYNAVDVRQLQLGDLPKLDDFWTDDLDVRAASPEQVLLGDTIVVKTPVRRVVIYPLRGGDLNVPGLTVRAEVLRRAPDALRVFEGSVADVTYTSAPLVMRAKPLPPGAAVDAIGELFLSCGKPTQANGGPVSMEVALSGRGNVRAAARPRFDAAVAGTVEVEDGRVTTARTNDGVTSSRRWKFLVFPEKAGAMTIPSMSLDVFVPSIAQRRVMRCTAQTLDVATAAAPTHDAPGVAHRIDRRTWLPWALGATLLVLFAAIALPRARRVFALRRRVAQLVRGRTPSEIREAIDARFRNLRDEQSPRGDAYRALRALLVAAERDRVVAGESASEIERRVRDLLV